MSIDNKGKNPVSVNKSLHGVATLAPRHSFNDSVAGFAALSPQRPQQSQPQPQAVQQTKKDK